jgi:hypothetical protein
MRSHRGAFRLEELDPGDAGYELDPRRSSPPADAAAAPLPGRIAVGVHSTKASQGSRLASISCSCRDSKGNADRRHQQREPVLEPGRVRFMAKLQAFLKRDISGQWLSPSTCSSIGSS